MDEVLSKKMDIEPAVGDNEEEEEKEFVISDIQNEDAD